MERRIYAVEQTYILPSSSFIGRFIVKTVIFQNMSLVRQSYDVVVHTRDLDEFGLFHKLRLGESSTTDIWQLQRNGRQLYWIDTVHHPPMAGNNMRFLLSWLCSRLLQDPGGLSSRIIELFISPIDFLPHSPGERPVDEDVARSGENRNKGPTTFYLKRSSIRRRTVKKAR